MENKKQINGDDKIFDLTIIGGGPAGITAAIYASRKQIDTLFITDSMQGQSLFSPKIENWIGEIEISGLDLSLKLKNHLKNNLNDFIQVTEGEKACSIKINGKIFEICVGDNVYKTKSVLITTGMSRKKIGVKNAEKFERKGVNYCAICDGPLYRDKIVSVIGAGNSAFESASQLLAYCEKVYLITNGESFYADPITVDSIINHDKLEVIKNADITEIYGSLMVEGLKYLDKVENIEKKIKTDGIFVEIGSKPATEFVADILELDEEKKIKIDPWTQRTSEDGIWAAGDCTNILYNQNNIAVGDAIVAIENIYQWIVEKKT